MIYNNNADFIINTSDGKQYNLRYFPDREWVRVMWQKSRDAIAGEEAVKANADCYLTKTPLMRSAGVPIRGEIEEYVYNGNDLFREYVQRASFFNGVGRTAQGIIGMLFRNDPQESERLPELNICYEWFSDKNENIKDFAQRLAAEYIATRLCVVVVDYPQVQNDNKEYRQLTKAEAERLNLAPYATLYPAESIIDIRYNIQRGRSSLAMLIVHETVNVPLNEFENQQQNQIRILDLDESGFYRQRVFVQKAEANAKNNQSGKYEQVSEVYPLINGQRSSVIPAVPLSGGGVSFNIEKPILNDLANINLKLFSNSADYELAIHEVCNPTPVFKGLARNPQTGQFETPKLGIFSGVALEPDGDAFYMQVDGAGIEHMKAAMDDKKNEMIAMGASLLTPDKRVAETAEAIELRRSGDNSVIMVLAGVIGTCIEECLYHMALWQGISEEQAIDIRYQLNTNYLSRMGADEAKKWAETWIDGAITDMELFEILQRGEVIPPDKTFDEHQKEFEVVKIERQARAKTMTDNENAEASANEINGGEQP